MLGIASPALVVSGGWPKFRGGDCKCERNNVMRAAKRPRLSCGPHGPFVALCAVACSSSRVGTSVTRDDSSACAAFFFFVFIIPSLSYWARQSVGRSLSVVCASADWIVLAILLACVCVCLVRCRTGQVHGQGDLTSPSVFHPSQVGKNDFS